MARAPNLLRMLAVAVCIAALAAFSGILALDSSGSTGEAGALTATGGRIPLPGQVSGGYWQNWGKPDVMVKDVPATPSGYNVVLIAFAYGDGHGGGGLVLDLPSFESSSQLKSDVATLHNQHRAVLLSIGGSNDLGVHLTNPTQVTQMVASLEKLIAAYNFDGIDWDLEHLANINQASLFAVSQQLKDAYGASFAITINSAPSVTMYKQLAQQLNRAGLLDMITHQYYDYSFTQSNWISGVEYRTSQLINTYGIPASKIGVGVSNFETAGSTTGTSDRTTVATTVSAWKTLQARYPGLRGIYLWSVNLDESNRYPFAKQIAPLIVG